MKPNLFTKLLSQRQKFTRYTQLVVLLATLSLVITLVLGLFYSIDMHKNQKYLRAIADITLLEDKLKSEPHSDDQPSQQLDEMPLLHEIPLENSHIKPAPLVDPWGNAYMYITHAGSETGSDNTTTIILSLGANGRYDTGLHDDITSTDDMTRCDAHYHCRSLGDIALVLIHPLAFILVGLAAFLLALEICMAYYWRKAKP